MIWLAIMSGIAYRLGGIGKPFRSWMRDWICPLIALITLLYKVDFAPSYWWAYLLCYGIMGGMLTTYWDRLFDYDNLWIHGFMIGMAFFPLMFAGIPILYIFFRSLALALIMGSFNWALNKGFLKQIPFKDYVEEFLRGVFIVVTLPILGF